MCPLIRRARLDYAYEQKVFARMGKRAERCLTFIYRVKTCACPCGLMCQREQGDAYKLSTKRFGNVLSTTRVEKVANLMVTYADSLSSTFIGYHILLPGICLRF